MGSRMKISYAYLVYFIAAIMPNDVVFIGNNGGGVTIYLTETIAWACILTVILNELVLGHQATVEGSFRQFPEMWAYLVWCSIAAILAIGIDGSGDTVGKVKNIIPSVLVSMMILRSLQTQKECNIALICMMVGLLVNAILGIMQFTTGSPYVIAQLQENQWKTDPFGVYLSRTANGLFVTPNGLASALLPGLVISLVLVFDFIFRKFWLSALLLITASVLSIATYVTFGKGAAIWAVLGVVVAMFPIKKRMLWFAFATICVGVLGIIIFGLSAATSSIATNTLVVRLNLWESALVVAMDNPSIIAFGDGIKYMSYTSASLSGWEFPTSHNTYIDQVLFFGLPGFVLYAALWMKALLTSQRAYVKCSTSSPPLLGALFGAAVALAGANVFEPRADSVFPVMQVLFLLSVLLRQSEILSGARFEVGEQERPGVYGGKAMATTQSRSIPGRI
jgi:hypothetical protein